MGKFVNANVIFFLKAEGYSRVTHRKYFFPHINKILHSVCSFPPMLMIYVKLHFSLTLEKIALLCLLYSPTNKYLFFFFEHPVSSDFEWQSLDLTVFCPRIWAVLLSPFFFFL